MHEPLKLYLDQMLRLDVGQALSGELLLPFLRLHSSEEFKNHLVILSQKRAKWVHTAQLPSSAV